MQYSVAQNLYRLERLNSFSTRTHWELAPVTYADGLVFLSNRPTNSFVDYGDSENREFSNMYYVAREGDGWGAPEIFSESFMSNYHDGPATFAQDGSIICLARAYLVETDDGGRLTNPNSGLYFASKVGEEWTDLESYEHNDPAYAFYTPHLADQGQTLYFSANLEDTRGGFDIYVSRMVQGRWTEPENLGDNINTSEDDLYPFLHPTGRMYFSSKGHDAFGGSDIFYSNFVEGKWTPAEKMETPINSGSDDYALILSEDFSNGYFTSKRVGGSPDIYSFKSTFPSFQFPRPIQKNRFCFRLRENSLDTIDYNTFAYEWVINDTLKLYGHDIKFCFPGPGEYELSFNVTNKVTDTIMYDVASLVLNLEFIQQPVISAPDTVYQNQLVLLSAEESYVPDFEIEGYYWDFGFGDKKEGIEVEHYFTEPGTHRVILGLVERVRRRFEPEKKAVYKEIVVLPEPE